MTLQQMGGRRFLLSMGCGVVTTVLVWYGKITDVVFASVVIATVGAYITGNVVSEIKGSKEPNNG